jgi:hypothetical protein
MELELQQKLAKLFDEGYMITVWSHFVDGPVQSIYRDDADAWVYDSEVYNARRLETVEADQVKVLKSVENWQDIKVD